MKSFVRAARPIRMLAHPARFSGGLIVAVWLALVQPGMSYYWLIDPAVHAQIDAELYGQRSDGETLPSHEHHPPHEHPASPGITFSSLALTNPFDAGFYRALLSPTQRQALQGQRSELVAFARSNPLAPPDQPPRSSN